MQGLVARHGIGKRGQIDSVIFERTIVKIKAAAAFGHDRFLVLKSRRWRDGGRRRTRSFNDGFGRLTTASSKHQ
jgi:hypothetical protein